jgi:calcineurin-like phosphoesterase
MRILFLGDVVGRAGRVALVNQLSDLRQAWKLDFVVVNAENATSGAGLNAAHAKAILEAGADCITLGDHAFDQKEMMTFIESEPRIVRPLNYAKSAPGRGARIFSDTRGRKSWLPKFWGRFS